ncbi:MAG: polymerase, sigma-24 subunit, subfamily [Verrucomicrobiales bacterium]|nr:polymerase, sigma-24 subunit, subfamily [Verrucomicrobiales bacterium]
MKGTFLQTVQSLFAISDEQAMWRVKMNDDPDAFAQLVSRWQQPIRNLCARMTGDSHVAEDLTQETFLRLYARSADYEPSGKFSTYIWRVALNLCYDDLRRDKRRKETSLDSDEGENLIRLPELAASEESPVVLLEANERAEQVKDALLKLPELYRTVVVLRHYEDLKFREIAEVLSVPEGTVKSRMAEAMSQLADLLKPALAEDQKMKKERIRL